MNLPNFDQESSDSHQSHPEDVEMLTMSATTSTNSPSIALSDMESPATPPSCIQQEVVSMNTRSSKRYRKDEESTYETEDPGIITLTTDTNPDSQRRPVWSDDELSALTDLLLFNSVGDKWLKMKSSAFWSKSAEFVHQVCKTAHTRTGTFTSTLYYQFNALYIGNACRSQVVTKLSKNLKSPCDAEKYFKTKSCDIALEKAAVSITRQSNIEEVSQQFQCYCDTIGIRIPNDFLQLAIVI